MRNDAKRHLAIAILVLEPVLLSPAFARDPGPSSSARRLQEGGSGRQEVVTIQPDAGRDIARYLHDPRGEPQLDHARLARLLREKIKYVFVIFNENHSFDNEFGSFPGVNGLYSTGTHPRSARETPGFTQTYTDETGATVTVEPFRMGPMENATVVDSVDHSHKGLATKLHLVDGAPAMDQFAYDEYHRFAVKGGAANLGEGAQFARLVMSHIDCDTIPFLWQWASRFTIFDNIFATEDTPSTPNAVAMIAGQSGETQWVEHGPSGQAYAVGESSGTTHGPPLVNDPQPFYGSQFDKTVVDRQPAGAKESYANSNIASNLTFATVPLTLEGRNVSRVMGQNQDQSFDLPDIQQDIPFLQARDKAPVAWRWYQEGYDLESTDTGEKASHDSYVSHHNAPQYFGYLANTPPLRKNFRGLTDFFTEMSSHALPQGGVFYIRGGYTNQAGLLPPITNPSTPLDEIAAIDAAKVGDDDHPSYSDRQISEAMAARVVNAIASNREIWKHSAIIITYDESDGFYDHVPPRILSYGPDGLPLSRGLRVPLLLVSPYARAHAVSHVEGDHNAVIETINAIFDRPALASLPDEAQALERGNSPEFNRFGPAGFEQKYLGPRDQESPFTSSLLSGFDPRRLLGISPPLPAHLAEVREGVLNRLPHYGGQGCRAIGVKPEDVRQRVVKGVPPGFNPLPATYPAAN
jgi:phospholipase C